MSRPPIWTGAPDFRPWTSENSARKGTDEEKRRRSSPMRKMTTAEKKRPARTKRATFRLRAWLISSRNLAPALHAHPEGSRAQQRRHVLVHRCSTVDEIAHPRIGRGSKL